jgi:streptomycin 6-kinase
LSPHSYTLVEEHAKELLLASDLHAWNVFEATREPGLVIDPKPFVGIPA